MSLLRSLCVDADESPLGCSQTAGLPVLGPTDAGEHATADPLPAERWRAPPSQVYSAVRRVETGEVSFRF